MIDIRPEMHSLDEIFRILSVIGQRQCVLDTSYSLAHCPEIESETFSQNFIKKFIYFWEKTRKNCPIWNPNFGSKFFF